MEKNVDFDQPWRRAVKKFENQNYDYGDLILHSWIEQAMELPELTPKNIDEWYSIKINNLQNFIDYMLNENKMFLINVKGVGYKICHPKEQTGVAMRQFINTVQAKAAKTTHILEQLDLRRLNSREKRQRTDAMAQLSQIKGFVKKRLIAPIPD